MNRFRRDFLFTSIGALFSAPLAIAASRVISKSSINKNSGSSTFENHEILVSGESADVFNKDGSVVTRINTSKNTTERFYIDMRFSHEVRKLSSLNYICVPSHGPYFLFCDENFKVIKRHNDGDVVSGHSLELPNGDIVVSSYRYYREGEKNKTIIKI